MSREHIVLLFKEGLWPYLIMNHIYGLFFNYLCSVKVRVTNTQSSWKRSSSAISDLSTTSGISWKHPAIAFCDPWRDTISAPLETKCSQLFAWWQCLVPNLQRHHLSSLIKGRVWWEGSSEIIPSCVLFQGITKHSPRLQMDFLCGGRNHPFPPCLQKQIQLEKGISSTSAATYQKKWCVLAIRIICFPCKDVLRRSLLLGD